jgi:rubrerythrin
VLYHSLQGAETYGQYIADAERAGKSELVEFFRECQEEENARAKRARSLLADSLDEGADDEDEDEEDDEDEDEDDEEEDDEED